MPFASAQDAINAIAGIGATQDEIIAFVRQLPVDAPGSVTMLCSGASRDTDFLAAGCPERHRRAAAGMMLVIQRPC
jgi:hypothetical protein